MSLGEAATKIAWPVFPCNSEKRPLDKGGFYTATRDPEAIRAAFRRDHAALIGVPTGEPSGLIVIDVDIRPGYSGMLWLDENRETLPETRTHKTRSGGLHLLFRKPEAVSIRNSASKIAPGIDVRGEGGYVVVPPSPGYSVADETVPAEMPDWLIQACIDKPKPQITYRITPRTSDTEGGGTKYGLAALDGECAAIRNAADGSKHHTINKAAWAVGGLVGANQLDEGEALDALLDALRAIEDRCDDVAAAEKTIRNSFASGKDSPRAVPAFVPRARVEAEPPLNDEAYLSSLEDIRDIIPAESVKKDKTSEENSENPEAKYPVVYFYETQARLSAEDFVEGLLIRAAMSVVYGQSNSGKTFFCSDMAFHLAAGMSWNGREVEHGGVLWLAMEGAHGISNRVAAWREHHGLTDASVHFAYIPVALNLLDPTADTVSLIETIKAVALTMGVAVLLVVVDTLARAIAGGNENSPEDMGALVTNGTKIQQATNAHVMWIHHSGKDEAKGARGHSSLRAATDTEIEISADGTHRVARVTKQREMECDGTFPFTLKVIELGINKRKKAVTSCVVVHSDQAPGGASGIRTRLTGHMRRAFDVLVDLIATSGEMGYPGTPSGVPSVPDKWWRERFYDRAMPDLGEDQKKTTETRRKAYQRASMDLMNAKLVGFDKGRVWLVRAQQPVRQDETYDA